MRRRHRHHPCLRRLTFRRELTAETLSSSRWRFRRRTTAPLANALATSSTWSRHPPRRRPVASTDTFLPILRASRSSSRSGQLISMATRANRRWLTSRTKRRRRTTAATSPVLLDLHSRCSYSRGVTVGDVRGQSPDVLRETSQSTLRSLLRPNHGRCCRQRLSARAPSTRPDLDVGVVHRRVDGRATGAAPEVPQVDALQPGSSVPLGRIEVTHLSIDP